MKYLSKKKVHDLCFKILKSANVNNFSANAVAQGLTYASLRGIDSHGLRLIVHYFNSAISGRKNPKPKMVIKQKFPSLLSLDANHAFGHAAGFYAIDKSSKIAKKNGICAISVFNSSHPGAMSSIVSRAAEKNLIGIGFTNADALLLSFNSKKPFFGTNPICFVFPKKNKKEPFCLDMATTKITWNKLNIFKKKKKKLNSYLAADSSGNSTNDPNLAKSLFPIGDYKGYGLASIVEIFCSIIPGMPFGPNLLPMFTSDINKKRYISQFYILMRPDFVTSFNDYANHIEKMSNDVKNSISKKKNTRVLLPNDPEIMIMKKRNKTGIPIEESLINEINSLITKNNLEIKKI